MKLINLSNHLYKKLLVMMMTSALLLVSFVGLTVSITNNLEANGTVLNQFGRFNTLIYQWIVTVQHKRGSEEALSLLAQIKHDYAEINKSLALCCSNFVQNNPMLLGLSLDQQIVGLVLFAGQIVPGHQQEGVYQPEQENKLEGLSQQRWVDADERLSQDRPENAEENLFKSGTESVREGMFYGAPESTAETIRKAEPEDAREFLFNKGQEISDAIRLYMQVIEQQNTQSIQWLRVIRLGLVLILLLSAATSFLFLKRLVLRPIAMLKQGMLKIAQGDLGARIVINTKDEFEDLSYGFNQMAQQLEAIYVHLEDLVQQRTQALERQKNDWEVLYQLTAELHENYTEQKSLSNFLARIVQVTQAKGAGLFLGQSPYLHLQAQLHIPENVLDELKGQLMVDSLSQLTRPYCLTTKNFTAGEVARWHIFPLLYQSRPSGVIVLYCTDAQSLGPKDSRLVGLLGSQLAIAIEHVHWHHKQKHYAVLEERNLISQYLHDSVAQSLAYLNTQVQHLMCCPALIHDERTNKNVVAIQRGIAHCYEDIRELLGNYRTKVTYDNTQEMIEGFVAHVQKRTTIALELFILSDSLFLTDDQKTQLIFILQEAISNSTKHSRATQITIVINDDKDFNMTIEDNGCGFDCARIGQEMGGLGHHIGLMIMQERAARIRAQLTVSSIKGSGTKIEFVLPFSER